MITARFRVTARQRQQPRHRQQLLPQLRPQRQQHRLQHLHQQLLQQAVSYGQVLLTMEAMKMETEIVAPADGTVASILVKNGDMVETGTALVALN